MYYFSATSKAGPNFAEALSIYIQLIRRMYWQKNRLFRDFLFWKPFLTNTTANWEEL